MRRFHNHYCSNCLRTQRFLDLGPKLVCECCSKLLWRTDRKAAPRTRLVLPLAGRESRPWREAV